MIDQVSSDSKEEERKLRAENDLENKVVPGMLSSWQGLQQSGKLTFITQSDRCYSDTSVSGQ